LAIPNKPFEPLRGVRGGIHYFIVAICDEDGTPLNLIDHKYLIEKDGRVARDNFAGLTKDERADYDRILMKQHGTDADRGPDS
jgi:hypothetical protein